MKNLTDFCKTVETGLDPRLVVLLTKPRKTARLHRLCTHEYLYILYSCMHNEKDE